MNDLPEIVGKKWQLIEIVLGGHQIPHVLEAGAEIVFDTDNKTCGHGGCNRFFGKYSIEESRIRVDGLASTRKYCIETMAVEDAFFKALYLVRDIRSQGDEMIMRSEDGSTDLTFRIDAISSG